MYNQSKFIFDKAITINKIFGYSNVIQDNYINSNYPYIWISHYKNKTKESYVKNNNLYTWIFCWNNTTKNSCIYNIL